MNAAKLCEFIQRTTWADLPQGVRAQSVRCLLDTLGTALAGRVTELSRIVHDFAAEVFAGRGARLWQDGREVSPPGAALANGTTIDSLDIHDGHSLTKGHLVAHGIILLPALVLLAITLACVLLSAFLVGWFGEPPARLRGGEAKIVQEEMGDIVHTKEAS